MLNSILLSFDTYGIILMAKVKMIRKSVSLLDFVLKLWYNISWAIFTLAANAMQLCVLSLRI